jgi:hypothetical protein
MCETLNMAKSEPLPFTPGLENTRVNRLQGPNAHRTYALDPLCVRVVAQLLLDYLAACCTEGNAR